MGNPAFSQVDRGLLCPRLEAFTGKTAIIATGCGGRSVAPARLAASAFETKGTSGRPLWKSGVLGSTCGLQTSEGGGGRVDSSSSQTPRGNPLNKAAFNKPKLSCIWLQAIECSQHADHSSLPQEQLSERPWGLPPAPLGLRCPRGSSCSSSANGRECAPGGQDFREQTRLNIQPWEHPKTRPPEICSFLPEPWGPRTPHGTRGEQRP